MAEGGEKGILQRVIDQIYEQLPRRKELLRSCEVRVSFLEIYKEQITDLLAGHGAPDVKRSPAKRSLNSCHNLQMHSVSSSRLDQENGCEVSSQRAKSKTFYLDQNLEHLVMRKRSSMNVSSLSVNKISPTKSSPDFQSTLRRDEQ